MIKFKDLLKENPDTLKFNDKYYKYNDSKANVSAFFTYYDKILDKVFYFGYSTLINNFFSDNKELLNEIKLIRDKGNYARVRDLGVEDIRSANQFIGYFGQGGHSGGHSELEMLLDDLKRKNFSYDPNIGKTRSRLFRVTDDTSKVNFVLTMWSPDNGASYIKYKDFQDKCLKDVGIDPKTVLYEVSEGDFETHDKLFGGGKEDDQKIETEIDKEIKKLNNEYSELMGSLHARGATLSTADEKRLQNQISAVKTKIDILKKSKEQGKTDVSDTDIQLSILKAIQNAPESDPKSLGIAINAELEKKFKGMPLAKIKQMIKGASLRDLVKEVYESFNNTKKNLFG